MGGADLRRLLGDERNSPFTRGRHQVALVYPASYRVGMASLGFLTVHRLINEHPDMSCERGFTDVNDASGPVTMETGRPLNRFPFLAVSVAWELEVPELLGLLDAAHIPPLREERGPGDPLILAGGPLTTVVPDLLGPVADVIFLGEAEQTLPAFLDLLARDLPREELLETADGIPGIFVPSLSDVPGAPAPPVPADLLPACSTFETPAAEFGAKTLIEVERGCARTCAFCVMSRTAAYGSPFRLVHMERIFGQFETAPASLGLVGAAVTDHPRIADILEHFVDLGTEVSLSSLRADRLTDRLLDLLKRGGMKTLTVAADGPSERIRADIAKGISGDLLVDLATRARAAGIPRMKLYQMCGFPTETTDDLREMGELLVELSGRISLTVTLSPLVPKPSTALAEAPFTSERHVKEVLRILRRAVKGRVIFKPVSFRDAALEYALVRLGAAAIPALVDHVRSRAPRGALVTILGALLP